MKFNYLSDKIVTIRSFNENIFLDTSVIRLVTFFDLYSRVENDDVS